MARYPKRPKKKEHNLTDGIDGDRERNIIHRSIENTIFMKEISNNFYIS